jgi:nucleoside-diphosphate-sugar epimerase
MLKKIVVTGGCGKAGRAVVKELLEHGYQVSNVDTAPPKESLGGQFRQVDLTNLGETYEALSGADAVVQLAAIPNPDRFTAEVTFRINTAIVYNVFAASVNLGLKRVVWASSETVLGLSFDREKPAYAPMDEKHPLYPESS